ncbi:gluconolactonase [Cupriavidus sp. YR651]|uniref:SMP-30/gluconolactonase/LRE family protein n=1 Tax=Cupriavidus sp. YR651 TaxID=1855315 RepID=UPI00088807D3|nr:SMP-30/gluconolactonase/LRE family protein [Cupriavidus sp. YR651]SDD27835.1 gluconolactonase [Cupriavidus sp. YR651]
MAQVIERIGDMRCGVGESPVWHAADAALYWTDIPNRTLWRFDPATGATATWTLPEMAGCIAMTADGGWLLAMETGIFRAARLVPGQPAPALERVATVAHGRAGMRFNDGRCDRQGRFWAGTMVMDMSLAATDGKLYRYDATSGALDVMRETLITPNGLAFSPDGRTMYLSDSHPTRQAVWAYDYDTDSGTPSNGRLFIDMTAYPGRPDGAAVDADGGYWICGNDAGQVHRFTPDGRLDRSLSVPAAKPAMCAFGGSGLDTLYVTSIRTDDSDLLSGAVFALQPGVRGLAEPVLRG